MPQKLQRQLDLMRARPDRRWSYTRDAPIDERGRSYTDDRIKRWVPYEGMIVEALLKIDAIISTAGVVAERSLVEQAGGFDEEQRYAEDYDLWLRLDYAATLREALRVLSPGGQIVVMDTPIYRDPASGAARVQARERAFLAQFGFRGNALRTEGFLTHDGCTCSRVSSGCSGGSSSPGTESAGGSNRSSCG